MIGGSNNHIDNKKRNIETSQETDEKSLLTTERLKDQTKIKNLQTKVKDLQAEAEDLQAQVNMRKEVIKFYRERFQDKLTTILSSDYEPAKNLCEFLENPVNAIILSDLDFNFKIKHGKYEGVTFAYALLTEARTHQKLLDLISDKIKHIDFNAKSKLGSPFYALAQLVSYFAKRGRFYDAAKDASSRNLLTTVLGEISLEELNINNTDEKNEDKNVMHRLVDTLTFNLPRNSLLFMGVRGDDGFFNKILNSIPLSIDFKIISSEPNAYGLDLQQRLEKTEWNSSVEFIIKLQETQKAWDKMKEGAIENLDMQEASKNLASLLDEAKALAVTAEKDGYWSAYYWLSKLHEDIFNVNESDMDNLNQFKAMTKKISNQHPCYSDMQVKLSDYYRMFQTPREVELGSIPEKERTEAQKAEMEALQMPRLATALRAAGRINNWKVREKNQDLYHRLGYMIVHGDEIMIDKKCDETFKRKLNILVGGKKKDALFLLTEYKEKAKLQREKDSLAQQLAELKAQFTAVSNKP